MNKEKDFYKSGLSSPLWQKKRLEILQRDNFTCQFCGDTEKTLHVHHKFYEKGRKPWEYEDKDLITLCDRCHEYITEESNSLYQNFVEAKTAFRKFGFSDAIFSAILSDFVTILECADEYVANHDTEPYEVIARALLNSLNYDDFKTMTKVGYFFKDFVENIYPHFTEDYNKAIENFNAKKDGTSF